MIALTGTLWLDLRAAFALLTRLPSRAPGDTAPPARCFWAFPLVGIVVGAIGAAIYWLAMVFLHAPALAAILALGATILTTGAFHEDGLADTADGLGGGRTRERRLEIMRDSRIGSYGAITLILSLGLRAASLVTIATPGRVAVALIAAHMLGRGGILCALAGLSPARSDGLAASAGRPPAATILAGLLISLILTAALLSPLSALAALIAAALGVVGMTLLMRERVGGYSGDTLGALEQVVECLVLIVLAAPLG